MMFNPSQCTIVHETLGQRLNRMVEDIRVHNPAAGIPNLKFKTLGRVTVLFRTDAKIGISVMEFTDAENQQVFDLALYGYKSAREVYEELKNTDKITEATKFFQFHRDWDLAEKLIEILR